MVSNAREIPVKSKERFHTLESMGDQTQHYNLTICKVPPKAYVRTAHMPYTKVGNFLTWSDFTSFSMVNLVVYDSRKHRLIMTFKV